MAKKFFYVCAGLLLLALAYSFGASRAVAQGAGNPFVGIVSAESFVTVITRSGDVYLRQGDGAFQQSVHVPGGSPVVSANNDGAAVNIWVICEDGSVYRNSAYAMLTMNSAWTLTGSIPGASTPTSTSTWGSVKVGQR